MSFSFLLHNEIVFRDLRNNANRKANCDTANIQKTVSTATAQIEMLKMSDLDIANGRLISDEELKKQDENAFVESFLD